jgi:DNA-directed RNA polymerase specialized sigma24 family protein
MNEASIPHPHGPPSEGLSGAAFTEPGRGSPLTPDTLWTLVVTPAAQGSVEHLEALFRTYKAAVCNLIRQHRFGLAPEGIEDLYQEFVLVCLRRDFLVKVHRSKGRFRHFLWTCVRRFLIDEADRAQRRPEAHAKIQVDNGVGAEQGLQIPDGDSDEWFGLDEAWALKLESIGVQKVGQQLEEKGLSEDIRRSMLERLMTRQDEDKSLKDEARRLGIPEARYNNIFYPMREVYKKTIRKELGSQVQSGDLQDEFDHFIRVLSRIRHREARVDG